MRKDYFDFLQEVVSMADYDEYCHYVAGHVGLGLSKLFYASGKEAMFPESTSNSMGLFLQVIIAMYFHLFVL